jgi:hypothetical protein
MAIRPEDLPSDPAALAEMVLAFDGENEDLRAQIATLKGLIFGARSERSAIICAEQLAFDLERTVDVQPPANDDEPEAGAPRTKRRKPRRNIGALPAHLPRCEKVIESRRVHQSTQPPSSQPSWANRGRRGYRHAGGGAGGAKGRDRGECDPAKHVPDTGPGRRVTGAGSHTGSCKAQQEGEDPPSVAV